MYSNSMLPEHISANNALGGMTHEQERPLHWIMDAVCVLEKNERGGGKNHAFFMKVYGRKVKGGKKD